MLGAVDGSQQAQCNLFGSCCTYSSSPRRVQIARSSKARMIGMSPAYNAGITRSRGAPHPQWLTPHLILSSLAKLHNPRYLLTLELLT